MATASSTAHAEDDNDVLLFNKKRLRRNTELSSYFECVTPAKDFRTFGLYEDDQGRLYRPRVVLTEEANGGATTKLNVAERYIFFDVYILPLPRITDNTKVSSSTAVISASTAREIRVKPKREEKAEPPEAGDKIVFHLRRSRTSDKISIKSFNGTVQEVFWGTLVVETDKGVLKTTKQENLGLMKILVSPGEIPLDRSLIVQPNYELQLNNRELPL